MDDISRRIDALERLLMEVRAEVRALYAARADEVDEDEQSGIFVEGGRGINIHRVLDKFIVEAVGGEDIDVDDTSRVVVDWQYVHPQNGGDGEIQILYGHPGKTEDGKIAIIPETYSAEEDPDHAGDPKWRGIETVVEESY